MLIRRDFLTAGAGVAVASGHVPVANAAPPSAASGAGKFTAIVAQARKIVSQRGVERLQAVRIGGIDQWVSVRGCDTRNPVLLYVHGGPGYISMPMSWWTTHSWEDYFTVVHWDQRGAGKTYLINDPALVAPTMTLERMVADTEEICAWLRQTLGKRKIFVLGHSWGSYLGLELARRCPEWLHAYIGVEQLTDGPESERRGWTSTLSAARKAGNATAVRELEAIAPYFAPGGRIRLEDIYTQRRWLDYYGGVMAFRHGNSADSHLAELSPDYTSRELAHIWDGNEYSERYLLAKVLSLDLSSVRHLKCPLVLFAGRYDTNVNSDVAAAWFESLDAPAKRLVWFERSAHLPMTEQPGTFLAALIDNARPLAQAAADLAPACRKG
jgi:proline iminopeptidase